METPGLKFFDLAWKFRSGLNISSQDWNFQSGFNFFDCRARPSGSPKFRKPENITQISLCWGAALIQSKLQALFPLPAPFPHLHVGLSEFPVRLLLFSSLDAHAHGQGSTDAMPTRAGLGLSGLPNANAKSQRFSYIISQIAPLPPVVVLNRSFKSQIAAG